MCASTGGGETVPWEVNVTSAMWVTRHPQVLKTKSQTLHRYHAVMATPVVSWPEVGADSSTTWGASTRVTGKKRGDPARREGSNRRGPGVDSVPGAIGL